MAKSLLVRQVTGRKGGRGRNTYTKVQMLSLSDSNQTTHKSKDTRPRPTAFQYQYRSSSSYNFKAPLAAADTFKVPSSVVLSFQYNVTSNLTYVLFYASITVFG